MKNIAASKTENLFEITRRQDILPDDGVLKTRRILLDRVIDKLGIHISLSLYGWFSCRWENTDNEEEQRDD